MQKLLRVSKKSSTFAAIFMCMLYTHARERQNFNNKNNKLN